MIIYSLIHVFFNSYIFSPAHTKRHADSNTHTHTRTYYTWGLDLVPLICSYILPLISWIVFAIFVFHLPNALSLSLQTHSKEVSPSFVHLTVPSLLTHFSNKLLEQYLAQGRHSVNIEEHTNEVFSFPSLPSSPSLPQPWHWRPRFSPANCRYFTLISLLLFSPYFFLPYTNYFMYFIFKFAKNLYSL